ncbi:MAG TPA: hypothetical protein VG994_07405 [Steroidobacteraceae bacterium]|nr:hypothetical protein [Steroidobacteraceae bacterium]
MRIPAETLDDMTRALGAAECASYRTCWYTGEELRFDCPGAAVARHGTREVLFRLYAGRVCASDLEPSFDPLLQALAERLHAHVIRG